MLNVLALAGVKDEIDARILELRPADGRTKRCRRHRCAAAI